MPEPQPETDVIAALTARRKELGIRQVDVAAIIGVGQQEVSNWERRSATPRLPNLERYAAALGGRIVVAFPPAMTCGGCGTTAPVGTEGWGHTDAAWCPNCRWLA